jgi:hypothetical protein
MAKTLQDFFLYKAVQVNQIADHSRFGINLPRNRDLHRIIMTVAMRVIAFAVDGLVLGCGHVIAVQPVRS